MNVNFYLRDKQFKTATPIQMYVSYNGIRTKYETGISTLPKYFKRQRLTAGVAWGHSNGVLDKMDFRIKELFRSLQYELGRIPSHVELKQAFQGNNSRDFFTYATQYAKETDQRINQETGKKINKYVKYHYVRTVKYLLEYAQANKLTITFENITLGTYNGYVNYLTIEKNLAPATIAKHISDWIAIMNAALGDKLHTNTIHKQFKKPSESKLDAVFCEEWELEELFNKKFDDPALEKVRDCFLVGCWTCLRHGNYGNIDPRFVSDKYIKLLPVKDGVEEVLIPLHRHVKAILKKRKGVLPIVSNNEMNKLLPVVCSQVKCFRVEVPKRNMKGGVLHQSFVPKYSMIKTHTARRSFASNADLRGIPDYITMKIGNWKSFASLKKYKVIKAIQAADYVANEWAKNE